MNAETTIPTASSNAIKYSEFNSKVNEFFTSNFPSGAIKVEAKTVPRQFRKDAAFSDEFKIVAKRDIGNGILSAEVKNVTSFGSCCSSKISTKSTTIINSANTLSQQFSISNTVMKGLKLDLIGSIQGKAAPNFMSTIEYTHPVFIHSTSIDRLSNPQGPLVTSEVATKFRDFKVGGNVSYDLSTRQLENYSVAVSLDRIRERACLQASNGFKTFTASYLQRFNEQIELGFRSSWSTKIPNMDMEIAAKWYLNANNGLGSNGTTSSTPAFIKAKLDNVGRMGIALCTQLRPNVTMTLGATLDTFKLDENAHKLGMDLVYSA